MFIRQIEESFPDYNKVIPAESAISVAMSRSGFTDAVRRIATLTSNKTSIIKLEFKDDKLVLVSQNPDAGEGRDEIDIQYDGALLAIGFNYRYLLDVLSVIDGDEVRFEINDQYSPGVIRSDEDPDATFVIMPMRIV
jgi:DNA polymerase-3 subunit beta